jgi:hypothetical protein
MSRLLCSQSQVARERIVFDNRTEKIIMKVVRCVVFAALAIAGTSVRIGNDCRKSSSSLFMHCVRA